MSLFLVFMNLTSSPTRLVALSKLAEITTLNSVYPSKDIDLHRVYSCSLGSASF